MSKVEEKVFTEYVDMSDEDVTEATNKGPLQEFVIRLDACGSDNYDVVVSAVRRVDGSDDDGDGDDDKYDDK